MKITRKTALKNIAGISAMSLLGLPNMSEASSIQKPKLKGRINHSVTRWPFSKKTVEELCIAAVDLGIKSVELIDPADYETILKYDLTCAMCNSVPLHHTDSFNNPKNHAGHKKEYFDLMPKVQEAGFKNIICFSGNRNGMDDEVGLENCAVGLDPIVKEAEKRDLTICIEVFNSKVNHPDYMADSTEWAVKLCEKLGSPNFKILYDIYHMQVQEGDIIATIRKNHQYIAHYHTAGVPGRNEIGDNQELNYKAIMEAIADTGFQGFVGQEFIAKNEDVFASLGEAIKICDV
ncbi:MAG: TIM barrel protein [Marinoscillum sp.]